MLDLNKALGFGITTAKEAGEIILNIYNAKCEKEDLEKNLGIEYKDKNKNDPVCKADKESNIFLCKELIKNYPDFGILTEEKDFMKKTNENLSKALNEWKEREYCWVIDPLDGTRNFIKRSGDFGVHIALVKEGEILLGVNYYPELKECYYASKRNGAFKEIKTGETKRISVSSQNDLTKATFISLKLEGKKRFKDFIKKHETAKTVYVGSKGLKTCILAEGKADIYVVYDGAYFWDFCSGKIILEEAGGKFTDHKGNQIILLGNKYPDAKITGGLLLSNKKLHDEVLREIS